MGEKKQAIILEQPDSVEQGTEIFGIATSEIADSCNIESETLKQYVSSWHEQGDELIGINKKYIA